MLHTETTGHGDPVVLLHGFTQSGAAWAPIAAALASHHRVVTIDAPGHGRSSEVMAGLGDGADMMIEVAPTPAAWVGYSMGGRFALDVALRHPDSVNGLALVSTTAGIEDPAERAARRATDAALADRIEAMGVDSFLTEWLAQPLFSTLTQRAAAIESRLGSTAEGLASSLRLAGTGQQEPAWEMVGTFSMPVLVVTGERDSKYTALGERLVEAIGSNARLHVVHGAGHACHLERPQEFLEVLEAFLAGDT